MLHRLGAIVATSLTTVATVPTTTAAAATPVGLPMAMTTTKAAAQSITFTTASAGAAAAARPRSSVTSVAHRGASAYAPENTIAAFRLADKQRADMFELDVQETKDHKLVLMHDPTLNRTTNVEQVFPTRSPWRIKDFTYAEIRRLDAGSWFAAKYRGQRVPTLRGALRAMDSSGMGLLLEIKKPELYRGIEGRVADELNRNPSWLIPGRVVVQSFNWGSMRKFHHKMSHVPIGLIGTPRIAQLPKLSSFADQVTPPHRGLVPRYIRRVHSLGMTVLAWTVNDAASMRRLISAGVDGIITNKPDVLARITDS
ncbi:glycerophosphodiester phosphodiesterase [Nonomuraea rhizosphaerae]|uniref:glycerophosphodiester phosphodiesterase n=1 Tax=Nonomuraea rhizosphaerae TaxID=2665663 RepID=UPI001FE56519|nr:glycerophosphodiester phosphodiesterase family protein [Nonomuraea rhizosphaerae]